VPVYGFLQKPKRVANNKRIYVSI